MKHSAFDIIRRAFWRDQSEPDEPTLAVENPDHLKTVPGTERVIGTSRRDPIERRLGRLTERFYNRRTTIEPQSLGRHTPTPSPVRRR